MAKGGVGGAIIDGRGTSGEPGQHGHATDLPEPLPDWLGLEKPVQHVSTALRGRIRRHGNWSLLVQWDRTGNFEWCEHTHLRAADPAYEGFGDGSDGVLRLAAGDTIVLQRDMYFQEVAPILGGYGIVCLNGFRFFLQGTGLEYLELRSGNGQ